MRKSQDAQHTWLLTLWTHNWKCQYCKSLVASIKKQPCFGRVVFSQCALGRQSLSITPWNLETLPTGKELSPLPKGLSSTSLERLLSLTVTQLLCQLTSGNRLLELLQRRTNSDSILKLFLWLASHCFCYYNYT